MLLQLPHQVPTGFTTFESQENIFFTTSNMFVTFTMTPPSTFYPLSLMHYYRLTILSEGFDNPSHDDLPPPPPPTKSKSHRP